MYESYIYLYRVYKNDVVHDHDEYEGRVFVVMFLYHVVQKYPASAPTISPFGQRSFS